MFDGHLYVQLWEICQIIVDSIKYLLRYLSLSGPQIKWVFKKLKSLFLYQTLLSYHSLELSF